jgi:hypothetical protein
MSRKPEFFSYNMPLYEVVTQDGLMRPVLAARRGGLYCGGSARQVSLATTGGCSSWPLTWPDGLSVTAVCSHVSGAVLSV